jgi:hypothetical protein
MHMKVLKYRGKAKKPLYKNLFPGLLLKNSKMNGTTGDKINPITLAIR